MKRLVTVNVCDWCLDRDPDSNSPAVVTRKVSLDGREPREVDVCQADDDMLQRLLGGRQTRPSVVRQTKMWDCPVCEETVRRSGAVLHLYRHTAKGRTPVQPKKCPSCKRPFPDPRGMSRHRQNAHGWDGFAEALAAAERERLPIRSTGPNGRARSVAASASASIKRSRATAH